MGCVNDILTSNNWRIAQSPGDGHCLIYSTISSWNSQLCNHPSINTTWLLDAIRREFNNNRDRYIGFLIDLEKEEIDRQLSLYLLDIRYNLDIVDVIPAVISNILDVTLKIINEQTNNTCDVIDVYPIQATNGVLAVHRLGDHYNGIVRALNSLPLHQRTTYTREELGQFNKSNLRLPRKLRKTLIKKKIWKPTRSTRVQKQRSCAKFALVNAQSVRNRTAQLLSDYVTSNNIDIA